ncbi:glycosyltransferase family 2 protein [Chloroflexota bacterium]
MGSGITDGKGPEGYRPAPVDAACRREALLEVGLFDEGLEAGSDVDLSRRLKAAGYRLLLRKDVTCRHYWRDDLKGYLRQQYNYAYYRAELTRRFGKPHDQVTGLGMILRVPFTLALLLGACLGSLVSPLALLLLLLLPLLHLPQAFSLLLSRRDACVLLLPLPLLFTLRDLCWVWAAVVWGVRRVAWAGLPWRKPAPSPADAAPAPKDKS